MKFLEFICRKMRRSKPPLQEKEVVQENEEGTSALFPLSIIPYEGDIDLEAVRIHISNLIKQKEQEWKQKNGEDYEKK